MFNGLLENNPKKHLGSILLIEYILFDVLRIFFLFLSGTGILNCLPPLFSIQDVEHLLNATHVTFEVSGAFIDFFIDLIKREKNEVIN